jgi:hypothetical protein
MKSAKIVIFASGVLIVAALGIIGVTNQQSSQQARDGSPVEPRRDRPSAASQDSTPSAFDASPNAKPPPVAASPSGSSPLTTEESSGEPQNDPLEESTPMPSTSLSQELVPVRDLFDTAIPGVRSRTQLPMLVPEALPASILSEPIYVTHLEEPNFYSLTLGVTPNCTANVCSLGSIEAERGSTPYPGEFSETVQLAQGVQGYFQPMSCGASCSLPVVGWRYEGAFYRVYLKLPGSDAEVRDTLIEVANSAIAPGSR